MQLQGKRVLITGASRGIGEALAHRFAGTGAKVALVARTQDALRSLAAELGGTAHPADLSDPTDVATLIQRVEDEAGPIDVLVNNAGLGIAGGFCDAPPDELRRVTEVNYLAPAELCRQVIPRMLERGGRSAPAGSEDYVGRRSPPDEVVRPRERQRPCWAMLGHVGQSCRRRHLASPV